LNDWDKKEIVRIVCEIAESTRHSGLMLNERYLHHCFSYLLQIRWNMLDLIGEQDERIALHPEWPTYKKQTGLRYGRYRKENGKYMPTSKGTAGFIDFAVGDYAEPEIGVEFSLKHGWSNEEIVYDFLKLMDKNNSFNTSISLNMIFRKGKLVRGKYLGDLQNHIDDAFKEAVRRLGNEVCDLRTRDLYLIVTEIAQDNNRRHWHYEKGHNRFEIGLPQIIVN
jgi:hypothetical protein